MMHRPFYRYVLCTLLISPWSLASTSWAQTRTATVAPTETVTVAPTVESRSTTTVPTETLTVAPTVESRSATTASTETLVVAPTVETRTAAPTLTEQLTLDAAVLTTTPAPTTARDVTVATTPTPTTVREVTVASTPEPTTAREPTATSTLTPVLERAAVVSTPAIVVYPDPDHAVTYPDPDHLVNYPNPDHLESVDAGVSRAAVSESVIAAPSSARTTTVTQETTNVTSTANSTTNVQRASTDVTPTTATFTTAPTGAPATVTTPATRTTATAPVTATETATLTATATTIDPAALARGACQSDLFDCAAARGAIFPERTNTYALFADPRLAALFALVGETASATKELYAMPVAAFQQPAAITPIPCTLSGSDAQDDPSQVISRAGQPPLLVSTHRYYMIDAANSAIDVAKKLCQIHLTPLAESHQCPGAYHILAAQGGLDMNHDGVEDILGLGACADGDAQHVPTFLDLLTSTAAPAASMTLQTVSVSTTFHLPTINYFAALRVIPKTDSAKPGHVEMIISGRMAAALGSAPWSQACAIEHAESATPSAACADTIYQTTGLAEPLAWAKHTSAEAGDPLGISVGALPMLCHHTAKGEEHCTNWPFAAGATSMHAVVVAPHALGHKAWPADVAVTDAKYVRLMKVESSAADVAATARPKEALPGLAPLDQIVESSEVAIGQPSHVLNVDLNGGGGDELCAFFTVFVQQHAHASVVVCHMNRNEAPVAALQAATVAPTDGSAPTHVTFTGSGEDPTDDTIASHWSIHDRNGTDVTSAFAVNGFVAQWVASTPGATSLFERLGELFIARAYAEDAAIAFPITATLQVCDPADACTQTTLDYGTSAVSVATPTPTVTDTPTSTASVSTPSLTALSTGTKMSTATLATTSDTLIVDQSLLNLDPAPPTPTPVASDTPVLFSQSVVEVSPEPTLVLQRLSSGALISAHAIEAPTAAIPSATVATETRAERSAPSNITDDMPRESSRLELPPLRMPPLAPRRADTDPAPQRSDTPETPIDSTLPLADNRSALAAGHPAATDATHQESVPASDAAEVPAAPAGFGFGGGGCSLVL